MTATETPRTLRKLAAIVVADVVGYSRQMGTDELGTLGRLRSLRADILDPVMREHGGRLVKLMGDGLLAEFASAVSATLWAVEVQKAIAARNEERPEAEPMLLRIGVNIGDVIIEDEDIFGEGVNVAARLEPLAPRGGVCISSAVHDHVRGKVAAEFAPRGEQSLKNIAQPVSIFCWSPRPMEDEPLQSVVVRAKGRKPSLALRPFEGAGSADASSLAAAAHEATVFSLANLSGITVLTDSERADFTATATIQAVGKRYRAMVRLLDNRSGEQFWSDRFDGDLEELFDAQDDLAFRISTALRFTIYDREVSEMEKIPVAERTSEMLFARIGQTIAGANREEWAEVGPLLDRLLSAEPGNSGGHAMKACWHLYEVFYGWKPIAPDDIVAAIASAREAVRCNERSDFAHMTMSLVHLYAGNDPVRALGESRRTLELNAYSALGRYAQGLASTFAGDPTQGLALCLNAAHANPRNVNFHRMMQGAALAAFLLGRHDDAIDYARRAEQQLHDVAPTLLILAAAMSAAGRASEGVAVRERLLAMFPDFSLGRMRRWPFRDGADSDRFVAALAAAGLPA